MFKNRYRIFAMTILRILLFSRVDFPCVVLHGVERLEFRLMATFNRDLSLGRLRP